MKPVMHGELCMLQRFKLQRGMDKPCARSRHLDRERAQARCVVATTDCLISVVSVAFWLKAYRLKQRAQSCHTVGFAVDWG